MNNICTPRIYVDFSSWAKAMGEFEVVSGAVAGAEAWTNVFGLNPSNQLVVPVNGSGHGTTAFIRHSSGSFGEGVEGDPNYCAILGHNMASANAYLYTETFNDEDISQHYGGIQQVPIVNGTMEGHQEPPQYDGFTILDCSSPNTSERRWRQFSTNIRVPDDESWTDDLKVGAICFGRYYDFPHSPDLKITQSIEMGELTRQQSVIGGSISNSMQTPDMWGDLGAWELDSPSDIDDASKLGIRRGKRIWNLSFSHLSDKDTLPINALGNTIFDIANASSYDSTDYTDGGESAYFNSNVLDGEDFFSAVWNKTQGLPFIFQPSGNNANPDQFAICRWDMNSLNIKQVAYNTYTINLKIREVW